MCCSNTFRLFVAFLTLLENGRLETPTLVYEKNDRVGKSLLSGQKLDVQEHMPHSVWYIIKELNSGGGSILVL